MDVSPAPKPGRPRTSLVRRAWGLARREWPMAVALLALMVALAPLAFVLYAPIAPSFSPGDYISHGFFAISMWRASPDSMTYIETDDTGHPLFRYTTSEPDLISRWFAYVNGEPPLRMYSGCEGVLNETPVYRTYTFSARGAIIERATAISGTTVCQYEYRLRAGATGDPFLYFLSDPHDSPSPPPVGHQEVP